VSFGHGLAFVGLGSKVPTNQSNPNPINGLYPLGGSSLFSGPTYVLEELRQAPGRASCCPEIETGERRRNRQRDRASKTVDVELEVD
jgi:hypothetical protein